MAATPIAGALAIAFLLLCAPPVAASWLFSGQASHLNVVELVAGSLRVAVDSQWSEPAHAFSPTVQSQMPGALGWWTAFGWTLAIIVSLILLWWRRLEPQLAENRLGRRPYDPRGSRPRRWARARDVDHLVVPGPQPGRFTLGRLDGRLLASDSEAHIAVIAPTRSGKTTCCVIPWLLEHDGPAIVTSTKTDVLHATREARTQKGEVLVWDPFGGESIGWTPLAGCDDWSYSLQQAQWLADAAQEGDSEVARYWRGEAAKLLAPLLHAAAHGNLPIDAVLNWLDSQSTQEPVDALAKASANAAIRQLKAVTGLDERNRGTSYMSAGSLLAAYRFPEVIETARSELTAQRFFEGHANTLYIVSSERHQRLLTPLVISILSEILHHAAEASNAGRPLKPTLRLLVDEAANIAPLRGLPAHLSQAAAHGVRVATIWQSLAQMCERYHEAADSILANSTVKVFMGPISDDTTRSHVCAQLGEALVPRPAYRQGAHPRATPMAHASDLRQLSDGRALALHGQHLPAVIQLNPYWKR